MRHLGVAKLAARRSTLLKLAAAAIVALAGAASPANAEMQIGVYGGWNGSFDSDIHLIQPGGTSMTLNDVPWDGNSLEAPPYWGLRGTYWFVNAPNWGFMVDYHHAKVIADQGAVVSVSGTRDGVPVGPKDRVGNTFETMEFTDGLNELFLGGRYSLDCFTVDTLCRLWRRPCLPACRGSPRAWPTQCAHLRVPV